jgi:ArsR family transcriptional regulator
LKDKKSILADNIKILVEKGICSIADVERYAKELEEILEKSYGEDELRKAAEYYKALSDPTRIKILKMLSFRPLCVCELTVMLEISQPAVTHHLKILERAGLIRGKRKGRWIYYELRYEGILKEMEKALKG